MRSLRLSRLNTCRAGLVRPAINIGEPSFNAFDGLQAFEELGVLPVTAVMGSSWAAPPLDPVYDHRRSARFVSRAIQ
jgi:hypothetical protein